ncbi:GDYXXLXY domain-containing protein [Methylobacterium sp. ID0610]|uniref:GDYXXLXY domain-containing protein n=1 Tax=Methylobacterium carpenticola TaxID=3344827 RepID=UPI0036CB3951
MIDLAGFRPGPAATIAAFALVFALQVAPAVKVARDQSHRLATGAELLLATATRDPRDLFRGEYSVLSYEVGQPAGLPAAEDLARACGTQAECRLPPDMTVYVTLAAGADGLHHATGIAATPPAGPDPALRGRLRFGTLTRGGSPACGAGPCFSGGIVYGIERWYGPQGAPAELDRLDRARIRVRVRVDPTGEAVLDALLVDGREVARTPRL